MLSTQLSKIGHQVCSWMLSGLLLISSSAQANSWLVDEESDPERPRAIHVVKKSSEFVSRDMYTMVVCDTNSGYDSCYQFYKGTNWDLCEIVDDYDGALDFLFHGGIAVLSLGGTGVVKWIADGVSAIETAINYKDKIEIIKDSIDAVLGSNEKAYQVSTKVIDVDELNLSHLSILNAKNEVLSERDKNDVLQRIRTNFKKATPQVSKTVECNIRDVNDLKLAGDLFEGKVILKKYSSEAEKGFNNPKNIDEILKYFYRLREHRLVNKLGGVSVAEDSTENQDVVVERDNPKSDIRVTKVTPVVSATTGLITDWAQAEEHTVEDKALYKILYDSKANPIPYVPEIYPGDNQGR